METVITTLSNNYLLISMDDERLLSEINNNDRGCLDIRQKMNHDLMTVSQNQLSKLGYDGRKLAELRVFLINKTTVYTKLINHYSKLSEQWKKQGHILASRVALVLVENEKLNLESFCDLITN